MAPVTDVPEPAGPRYDRAARQAERARLSRLGKLPFLYEFSQQGRPQAIAAVLLQGALAFAVGLGFVRLVTGDWLPPFAAIAVLAAALGLQAVSRFLNARVGRK